jgi:hypothetical protein
VIAGKVLVTCEPGWGSDCPVLCCFDAASGALLWQQELDPFADTAALTAEERQQATALRQAHFERYRRIQTIRARTASSPADKKQKEADLAAAGHVARNGFRIATPELQELVTRYGYTIPHFAHVSDGLSFATPVSDGVSVWAVTGYKAVFCCDLATGALRWCRYYRSEPYHAGGARGMRNRQAAEPDEPDSGNQQPGWPQAWAISPLLHGDRLQVFGGGVVRAYRAADGTELWRSPPLDPHRPGSTYPHVIDHPLLLDPPGVGPCLFVQSGDLLHIADGALLVSKIGDFTRCVYTAGNGRDAIIGFNQVGSAVNRANSPYGLRGPAAGHLAADSPTARYDFSAQGDGAAATVAWTMKESPFHYADAATVWHGDTLYVGHRTLRAIDTGTGTERWQLAATELANADAYWSANGHGWTLAGQHLFAFDEQGKAAVVSLDGKLVASNRLDHFPSKDPAKLEQIAAMTGTQRPGVWHAWNFARALPFFSGSRMYVRSHDWLYCIGAQ